MNRRRVSLDGKVVAITGGGRGIGAATARALAGQGAKVAIGDIDRATAQATAAEIGARCIAFELDVTDQASFVDFLDQAAAHLGPLDVLINNAGIMPIGSFLHQPPALTDRIVQINLQGVITGSRLALERMTARGSGHLINVSSLAGRLGSSGAAVYCASKAAVITLTQALNDEFADGGIAFSCVMPGVVKTELSAGLDSGEGFLAPVSPEQVAAAVAATIVRPRLFVDVPRLTGVGVTVLNLLPPKVRQRAESAAGTRHMVLKAGRSGARDAYEARAAGR